MNESSHDVGPKKAQKIAYKAKAKA